MNTNNQSRIASIVGMISAGLWLIALFIEYSFRLEPPGDGSLLYYADQVIYLIALVGYVILLLGLWRSKAAGDGIFGRVTVGMFVVGLVALIIATLVSWLTSNPDFFLYPVGGLFQLLGGLLTGIAVALSKRWDGWQRWAPLLQGLYYLIALMLPLVIANQPPTQLGESLWQVTWFITCLALFTKAGQEQRTVIAA